MGFFISTGGQYYEGDKAFYLDQVVPQRPDFTYDWNGSTWVFNASRVPNQSNNLPPIISDAKMQVLDSLSKTVAAAGFTQTQQNIVQQIIATLKGQ